MWRRRPSDQAKAAKPRTAGGSSAPKAGFDARDRRAFQARLAACTALAVAALFLGGALAIQQIFLLDLPPIPERDKLWAAGRPQGLTFLDPYGRVIARRGPRHGEWVRVADLPPAVPLAFLAIEDRRFYSHGALDAQAIARAVTVNLRAGETREGASTLTQQLARTLFLRPEKTFKRKVQEALLASRLERMLSKDQLLELYLNRVYFGDRAYGLSAAAETYFGKSARQLTLSEAALLAALPKAPTRLALTNDLPAAWSRARLVLASMHELGWIDAAALKAADRPPEISPPQVLPEGDMAWVLDAAAAQAQAMAGDASPDLVVQVTVDPALQAEGSKILRQTMATTGRSRRASQAALLALAPDGAVRAMVGGVDYRASPFNRVLQARRQPGSAFKPFVWAAALEHGVNPYDLRRDGAIRIGAWSPQNYGGGYHGMMTVERALRLSVNTVSVRLTQEVGPAQVAALARRFGMQDVPVSPGPSLALGAYEVSLLELTGAYQVLQSGGGLNRPYLVSRITNGRGEALYAHTPSAPFPAYGAFQAAQMVRMMEGVITNGTGRRAAFGRMAAGKTGTSQNFRDAWFVGFTPDWVCGVWVGNDDNRPMAGVTGGQIPADIWRRFMVVAHRNLPESRFGWAPEIPVQTQVWAPPEPDEVVEDADRDWPDAEPVAAGQPRVWLPGDVEDDAEPSPYDDGPAQGEVAAGPQSLPPPARRLTWPSRGAY